MGSPKDKVIFWLNQDLKQRVKAAAEYMTKQEGKKVTQSMIFQESLTAWLDNLDAKKKRTGVDPKAGV